MEPSSSTTTGSEAGSQELKAAQQADAGGPDESVETFATEGFGAATVAELRKVVWPSRQQLFSESVAVILMVSLSAAAIAAIDRFFGWAARVVFR